MERKMGIIIFAWLFTLVMGFHTAWAGTEGGMKPVTQGEGTEVQAGIVVDYMGKIRFEVKEEGTRIPIPGASVELFIPFLNGGEGAYVLVGVTDEEGIYELDVAFDTRGQTGTFENIDGDLTFTGSMLYMKNRNLQWRVYKAGWMPYPRIGTTELYAKELPQVIQVLLHRRNDDIKDPSGDNTYDGPGWRGTGGRTRDSGESGGTGRGGLTTLEDGEVPLDGIFLDDMPVPLWGIPKTGVETYARYWAIGFLLLLTAAGFTVILLIREGKERERVR